MNSQRFPSTRSLAVAGSVMIAAAVQPTGADVITAVWNHDLSFSYEITHMPDLDQRRAPDLPNGILGLANDGSMYCVPTGTMNMFIYAANHGFSGIMPGPGDWQSNDLYNTATLALGLLGAYMSTDPADGTGGFDSLDGAVEWLDNSADGDKFTVELKYFTGFLGPNLNSITQAGIKGHLVAFAYGFYEHIGTHEGLPYYERDGGHMVTLARAFRDGDTQLVWVRDPADDARDLHSQSTFVSRLWNVTGHAVYVRINGQPHLRLFSALGPVNPSATARFIDTALILRPKAGYSFKQIDGVWKFLQHSPWKFVGTNHSPAVSGIALAETGVAGSLVHATASASGTEAFAITQIPGVPNQIVAIDTVAESSKSIATLPGASHLAVSPKGQLYILSQTHLNCINLMEQGKPLTSTPLPSFSDAITYDALRDEVVVASFNQEILRYAASDITQPPIVMQLPPPIAFKGNIAIAVCPLSGMWWVGTQLGNTLHGWSISDTGAPVVEEAMVPGITWPTAIDFDDNGHMFVSDGSMLVEMHKTFTAGWQPVPNSAFTGLNVGPFFRMTRSEANFDPELHTEGYFNIHPDLLEFGELVFDCYEDLDRNGVVGVPDLLLMLGAWGACDDGPCPADLTGNRMVGVPDLLQLLGAWGPCP